MLELYVEKAKLAAYFLWEYTSFDDALHHWCCAEDISCFFEISGVFDSEQIEKIKEKDKDDSLYIQFVQHIAFRIFVYTNQNDPIANWFVAEKLLENPHWCDAICAISNIYAKAKTENNVISTIHSEKVRSYYSGSQKYYN